ncbi:MAG: hypothetical protein RSE43_09550, partial [Oscillospiraceae bacterium]
MNNTKKETASAATETASNISTKISVSETAAPVNAPPNWWSGAGDELRAIRVIHTLKGADMAAVVKELYPRHNRQLLSHCEHGEETGVMLRPDALNYLKLKYCPESIGRAVALPAKRKASWRSRTKQIHCRLTDDKFEALQRRLNQDEIT